MKNYFRILSWSVIVSLGGFLFGFDTAVISGVEKTIQAIFSLTSVEHGFTISSALIGTVIGALGVSKPVDKYGRRPMLLIIASVYLLSAVGCAFSFDAGSLIFFRFIGGLGVGGSSVVAPMYISEVTPAKVRGQMTAIFQINVIFGILMAYVSNYLLYDLSDYSWRIMLGIEGGPALIYFILLFFVPESPRFLVMKNKIAQAKEVLMQIDDTQVEQVVGSIQQQIRKNIAQKGALFTKANKKAIIVAFLVAMFNQFSGINAILYYAPRIFEQSGLSSGDSLLQSVAIGIVNLVFTFIGFLLIDKAGRRKLLMFGSMGMAVCLGVASYIFFAFDLGGIPLLISILFYIAFFGMSTGAVIWVLIAEVFPNSVRSKGQSLGSLTHWLFAALITFCFPVIAENGGIGLAFTFGFFSIMMLLQMLVAWLYFPETKGKSLEELSENL